MFTIQELQNLSMLLSRSNITGQEAIVVVLLQEKINSLINEQTKETKKLAEESKKEDSTNA